MAIIHCNCRDFTRRKKEEILEFELKNPTKSHRIPHALTDFWVFECASYESITLCISHSKITEKFPWNLKGVVKTGIEFRKVLSREFCAIGGWKCEFLM